MNNFTLDFSNVSEFKLSDINTASMSKKRFWRTLTLKFEDGVRTEISFWADEQDKLAIIKED